MEHNNFAHFWCAKIVDQLISCGVDHFFIAPGSRSIPFLSAIVRHQKANIFSCLDERSLAFMALGYSKVSLNPALVLTTSGTAVANLLPAIVESYWSEIPLLILTADRPYEDRDTSANQTIDQVNIFANHIKKSFDLPPPSSSISLTSSWAVFDQALLLTKEGKKSAVHINLQFREPVSNLPHNNENYSEYSPSLVSSQIHYAQEIYTLPKIFHHKKGLLVIGELNCNFDINHIIKFSEYLGWPIFADVNSNLRFMNHKNILHHFDLALLNDKFIKELSLEAIVKLGGRLVSKRFLEFIDKANYELLSIETSSQRLDPTKKFTKLQITNLSSFLSSIINQCSYNKKNYIIPSSYNTINNYIDNYLDINKNTEGYFCARLIANIAKPSNLFLSNSMPIRYVNQLAKSTSVPIKVCSNRGASGIDGILSTAAGVAIATQKITTVLIGDLAFIHDSNGLMNITSIAIPMLIVIINNRCGGIFHLLPIAHEQDVLTPYIDNYHNTNLSMLCRAHNLDHVLVDNYKYFDECINMFYEQEKTMAIEVVVNLSQSTESYLKLLHKIKHAD